MADLQVTVAQVAVRNTSGGKTVYDVQCGDGETRQVWEANLANAINTFSGTGQPITIREQVSQNGQYTNRTIKAFAPPGQALPADNGGNAGGGFRKGGGMSPEDKTRIAKMAAQGTAYGFVGALFSGAGPEAFAEALEHAEALVKALYKSARSHEKSEPTVLQTGAQGQVLGGAQSNVLPVAGQPVAGTPAEVAAQVPGVQVGVAAQQDATAEAPQAAPANDDIDWN